jgi:hypothetical protein
LQEDISSPFNLEQGSLWLHQVTMKLLHHISIWA